MGLPLPACDTLQSNYLHRSTQLWIRAMEYISVIAATCAQLMAGLQEVLINPETLDRKITAAHFGTKALARHRFLGLVTCQRLHRHV